MAPVDDPCLAPAPSARPTPSTAAVWGAFETKLAAFLRAPLPADQSDDVLQDVFLRIHKSLSAGTVPRDLGGWVHQIARNAVIDHYRRRAADLATPHPNPADAADVPADPHDLDSDHARAALAGCVRPLVDALPGPYRDALVWTAFEGMPQADAAARAGVSVSGMKSRVQRGRRQLADAMMQCCALTFDARGAPMECSPGRC